MAAAEKKLWGVLAEFRSPDDLIRASERVRDAGYTRWDAHAPFPVHGLDDAMGIKPTILPWIVLGAGLTGVSLGFLMQYWMNAVDYKIIVAGKPFNSFPSNVPIMFESMVLLSALTAFFSMLALNGLPQFAHPLFRKGRFRKATTDGFFISIEASDPRFDVEETEELLRKVGGVQVEWVEA